MALQRSKGSSGDRVGVGGGVLLALMTASGMLPGTIMAVIVTVARATLGFSTTQAGMLAAADIYGAAAGALVTAAIGVPARWRRVVALALLAMVALDLVSMILSGFPPLLAVRGLRGIIGGVVMGVGYGLIGRSGAADRIFGMLLVTQFVIGAAGIALLPALVIARGAWLLFAVLAGAAAAMIALLPMVPAVAVATPVVKRAKGRLVLPALAALVALVLFQAAHTAGGAYLLELGRQSGFALPVMQKIVGLAASGGAVGASIVAVVGGRFGRIGPILLATVVGIAGNLLLLLPSIRLFGLGAGLGAIAWGGSIPFVLGLCATMDAEGRAASWASFAAKIGLASGPVLGAAVIGGGGFAAAVWLASALSIVAAMLLVLAERLRG